MEEEEEEEKEPLGILRSAMLRNMRAMEKEENLSSCSPEDKKAKVLSTLFFTSFLRTPSLPGGVVNKSLVYFLFVLDFASLPYFFEGKTVPFLPKMDNQPLPSPPSPFPSQFVFIQSDGFHDIPSSRRTDGGREGGSVGGGFPPLWLIPGKKENFSAFYSTIHPSAADHDIILFNPSALNMGLVAPPPFW